MTRITIAASLALIALMAWAPAADACQGGARPPTTLTVDAARHTVACLINQRRHHHHLRRLREDAALLQAGQEHSDAMASENFFAHDGSDGTPLSRASWAGYGQGASRWGVGENLGFGTGRLGTPKAIVRAWMRSAIHRAAILSKRWRQIGVGVTVGSPMGVDGKGMATYTVDFGFRHG
jgi:uncharacterized protein YkwD